MNTLSQLFQIKLSDAEGRSVAVPWEGLRFPGGELHVRVDPSIEGRAVTVVQVTAHLRNTDAVLVLLLLTDALKRLLAPGARYVLDMPYVPYARQDRCAMAGEALSAKVFCALVNSLGFDQVIVADPHSDVVPALLNNVVVRDAVGLVAQVLRDPVFQNGVTLMAPDAGARKRVLGMAKRLGIAHVAFADKIRDVKTGAITGTQFPADIPVSQPVLVVDDICDGGRTFVELARAAALTVGPQVPLYLYITHGIFSKGLEELKDCFRGLYTAYDWTESGDPKLTVIG